MDNIYLYYLNVNKLDYETIYPLVSKTRKDKISQLRNKNDKLLSLGAEYLYMSALKDLGINYQEIIYEGKPHIDGIKFNLSHSGEYAVCAISDKEIGVDIEEIKEAKLKVAKRHFTNSEYQDILSSNNQNELFYSYWTKKESLIKNIGLGLRIPLNSFEIKDNETIYNNQKYYFYEIENINKYKCSICSELKTNIIVKQLTF